jgi:hypothetical protein
VTGRKSAVLLAAAMLIVPAAAQAKTGSIYDVTFAKGFERLTFLGDADTNCAQFGVCGYDGTVTYRIGDKPKGKVFLTKGKSGKVRGSARYATAGRTEATVTPPAPGTECQDSVGHKTDVFTANSSGSRFQSLLVGYHDGASTDYLETACPGLTEADVRAADALPEGLFRAKDFFRGPKPALSLSGSTPFRTKGFNANVRWDLKFKLTERDCSPRCKLPAGKP